MAPPSIEELHKRLIGRATDSPEKIQERVAKAATELLDQPQFDTTIVNDDLNRAKQELIQKVNDFLL